MDNFDAAGIEKLANDQRRIGLAELPSFVQMLREGLTKALAEIARLTRERKDHKAIEAAAVTTLITVEADRDTVESTIARLRGETAWLRMAFWEYGRHTGTDCRSLLACHDAPACDCGLNVLLAAVPTEDVLTAEQRASVEHLRVTASGRPHLQGVLDICDRLAPRFTKENT